MEAPATPTGSGLEGELTDSADELARKSGPPRHHARPVPYAPRHLHEPPPDKEPQLGGESETISARGMPIEFTATESHLGQRWLSRAASVTSFVSAPAVIGIVGLLLFQSPSRPHLVGPSHVGEIPAQTATAMPGAAGMEWVDVKAGLDAEARPRAIAVPAATIGSVANAVPSRVDQRTAGPLRPELPEGQIKSAAVPLDPRPFALVNTDRLISRAESLIQQGDISGARLLLEPAVDAGSAQAAFLLAQTYDRGVLASRRVRGIAGDDAKARSLYTRAYQGGIVQARERIDAMR